MSMMCARGWRSARCRRRREPRDDGVDSGQRGSIKKKELEGEGRAGLELMHARKEVGRREQVAACGRAAYGRAAARVDEKFSLLCTWMMRVEVVQEDS